MGHARRLVGPGLFIVLAAIGAARIVSTYGVFNQTWDEPAHIAAGMEWLDRGSYIYETQHPPLARVATALGPFVDGSRSIGKPQNSGAALYKEGNQILHAGGTYYSYFRTLKLARLGILPFFLVAAAFVWAWSRRLAGEIAALTATALFTTLPPVLAHAGLATTDMAIAATLLGATFFLTLWLERPTHRRSLALGLSLALALLSKFSAVVFLPASFVLLALGRWLIRSKVTALATDRGLSRSSGFVVAGLMMLFSLWAGYQFSFGPIFMADSQPHFVIDEHIGSNGPLHDLAYAASEEPIYPAPELFRGIGEVIRHNDLGHSSFLLGERRSAGWWYFYPVALAVKSPIPFLLLTAIGFVVVLWRTRRAGSWEIAAPALCAMAVLLAAMPSNINIGIRHILPIYPFLAIVAGVGAAGLWNLRPRRGLARSAVIALIGWQFGTSLLVHPDYLAYFNEVVVHNPERVLVDSDLDWGQDIKRLSDTLRRLNVSEVSLAVAGAADLKRHKLPAFRRLTPYQPTSGWIALGLWPLKVQRGYSWLDDHEFVTMVGKSIRLYNLSEKEALAAFRRHSDLHPDNLDYQYQSARAFFASGDHDRAIAYYGKAIAIKPDFALAFFGRGVVYHDMGDDTQAVSDFDEAIRLAPDLADAYGFRGLAQEKLGHLDAALRDYERQYDTGEHPQWLLDKLEAYKPQQP